MSSSRLLLGLLLAGLPLQQAAELNCLNECSHHGECSDGVCVCEAAFTGQPHMHMPQLPCAPPCGVPVGSRAGLRAPELAAPFA